MAGSWPIRQLAWGLRLRKSTDRRVADRVAPRNLDAGFASLPARECFALLMRRQLGLAAEPNASGFGADAPLAAPGKDQMTFELRETTQHREHQSAVGGCGIGPGIA